MNPQALNPQALNPQALNPQALDQSAYLGWWVGYGIGIVLVVVVVVLLLLIIESAYRISAVADDITSSLQRTQQRTEALWEINTTNEVAAEILDGATAARNALGDRR